MTMMDHDDDNIGDDDDELAIVAMNQLHMGPTIITKIVTLQPPPSVRQCQDDEEESLLLTQIPEKWYQPGLYNKTTTKHFVQSDIVVASTLAVTPQATALEELPDFSNFYIGEQSMLSSSLSSSLEVDVPLDDTRMRGMSTSSNRDRQKIKKRQYKTGKKMMKKKHKLMLVRRQQQSTQSKQHQTKHNACSSTTIKHFKNQLRKQRQTKRIQYIAKIQAKQKKKKGMKDICSRMRKTLIS